MKIFFKAKLLIKCTVLFVLLFSGIRQVNASYVTTEDQGSDLLQADTNSPKIIHIVNFIRLLEPRDPAITEEVLYQTVVKQIELMNQYNLPGTFLLQYDALLDTRYQKLLRLLPKDRFEIGGWLEVPQPLAENAGLKWRGNAPWDSRADVDFTTGYTPKEREKLIDTYMRDFKRVFGDYPKTVGCWYLDAYSLHYMYRKYGIIASCNCKDQIGTDGYTLWGGYWNQAYYPSRQNAYMPAQTQKGQIPVPVFRMLGSDPIRQYDDGIGTDRQGVITLEPVYKFGGGDTTWVDWFFKTLTQGQAMAFGYAQAGQENSFTWKAMKDGLQYQFRKIAALRQTGSFQVETMAKTARWYKKQFNVTPVTSVTALTDLPGGDQKTVWLDSRFYRINLLWDNSRLRIRDIHLFDEMVASPYYNSNATGSKCTLFTLPFVDGHFWSTKEHSAGLVFLVKRNGRFEPMEGKQPVVTKKSKTALQITWPLKGNNGTLEIQLAERYVEAKLVGGPAATQWKMQLITAKKDQLPFTAIAPGWIKSRFLGHDYTVKAIQGHFATGANRNTAAADFEIVPEKRVIRLDLGDR